MDCKKGIKNIKLKAIKKDSTSENQESEEVSCCVLTKQKLSKTQKNKESRSGKFSYSPLC